MEGDSYKLLGTPVGHHGPYAFYKALKVSRKSGLDQIVAIGDFFFVKLWPDSELMAVGELQLLWTDRVSGKTLASLRLYFLPENTPAGRSHHGEDEVVAISERVVVRAEELLSWAARGAGSWPRGLKAAWAPPPPGETPEPAPPPDHRLDFTDINREKGLIADPMAACVVVFSYPRYCRYRAMMRRLQGLEGHWLRDSLVVALGGYAPPSSNTLILYCRETFEYPELEGHEFVCNHMAPRLKGRVGRGRRRRVRSASKSSESDSGASVHRPSTPQTTRSSLRSSAPSPMSPSEVDKERDRGEREKEKGEEKEGTEERAFLRRLRIFHQRGGGSQARALGSRGKDLSLHRVYESVRRAGGYDHVTRTRGWRRLLGSLGAVGHQATMARRNYERLLLPLEQSERRTTQSTPQSQGSAQSQGTPPGSSTGTGSSASTPLVRPPRKKQHLAGLASQAVTIATIDISDSPVRELDGLTGSSTEKTPVPRLQTPPPGKRKDQKKSETTVNGDKKSADTVKRKILEEEQVVSVKEDKKPTAPNDFDPSNILDGGFGENDEDAYPKEGYDYVKVSRPAADLNQEFLDSLPGLTEDPEPKEEPRVSHISLVPPEKLLADSQLNGGGTLAATPDKATPTRSRPSSLRSVRVKPDRRQAQGSPPSLSSSSTPTPVPPPHNPPSDDDLIEVPYKPKSPEIIDLDLYESPESPQTASKRKKLDILKRGGLEVTAVRGWPGLDPAFQQQILNQAHFLQVYGTFATNAESYAPPPVTQAKSIYGTSSPEKTVYGNPKDPFMPPPHVLQGSAPRKVPCAQRTATAADVLDLTVKPAVEIVRVPGAPEQPQNLSARRTSTPELRQVNSALEITLVNKNHSRHNNSSNNNSSNSNNINRTPQKRSSTGKFMSNKGGMYANHNNHHNSTIPPLVPRNASNKSSNPGLIIPNYQVSSSSSVSPVSSGGGSNMASLLQGAGGSVAPGGRAPLLDPSLYMSALYGSLGHLAPGISDRQLALYSQLVKLGGYQVPTSKN